jgi:hypothetical protein
MQFTKAAILSLLAVLPTFTTAAPVEAVEAEVDIVKRVQTQETVYLTNCGASSQFSYYRKGHNSEDKSPPDDVCPFNTGNNLPINWENQKIKCTFKSGVSFKTSIANRGAINEFAGSGTQRVPGKNPKEFDCFRDNERILYRKGGVECHAVYWCNPR